MTTATPRTAAVLEPETQKFVDSLAAAGGPPLYTLTPDAARDLLAGAQAIPVTKLPASIETPRSRSVPPDRSASASSGPKGPREPSPS